MTAGCGSEVEKHCCTQQYAKNVDKRINMDPTDINEWPKGMSLTEIGTKCMPHFKSKRFIMGEKKLYKLIISFTFVTSTNFAISF